MNKNEFHRKYSSSFPALLLIQCKLDLKLASINSSYDVPRKLCLIGKSVFISSKCKATSFGKVLRYFFEVSKFALNRQHHTIQAFHT